MDKRKFKASPNVAGDWNMPTEYGLWAGRNMAIVQENVERLRRLLERHGWPVGEVILVGDRTNLNDQLAVAYDDHGLRYLAGLQPHKKAHRQLLTAYSLFDWKSAGNRLSRLRG